MGHKCKSICLINVIDKWSIKIKRESSFPSSGCSEAVRPDYRGLDLFHELVPLVVTVVAPELLAKSPLCSILSLLHLVSSRDSGQSPVSSEVNGKTPTDVKGASSSPKHISFARI